MKLPSKFLIVFYIFKIQPGCDNDYVNIPRDLGNCIYLNLSDTGIAVTLHELENNFKIFPYLLLIY